LLTILAENQIPGIRCRCREAAFAERAGHAARRRKFLLQCKIDWNDSNRCSVEHKYGRFPAHGRKP
jgi:hypothetical protein